MGVARPKGCAASPPKNVHICRAGVQASITYRSDHFDIYVYLQNVHIWHGVCCISVASFTHNKRDMPMHTPSRRSVLTSGAALAAIMAAPGRLRAAPKEIVIGGPAGAAKYFNADLFPRSEERRVGKG